MKTSLARRVFSAPFRWWHATSAFRRPCCRFTPSCSEYAIEAVNQHGVVRGYVLAARRIVRCRPGARFGFDPVPPVDNFGEKHHHIPSFEVRA